MSVPCSRPVSSLPHHFLFCLHWIQEQRRKIKTAALMYVRKMFQISSLISDGSNSNANDTEKTHSSYFAYRKNPYRVLAVMPKWTVFCFYLRSISIGLWVLLKWTLHFMWKIVRPTASSRRLNTNSIEYYGSLHDKPPPCLVDNRIGLQSYVKLKVCSSSLLIDDEIHLLFGLM